MNTEIEDILKPKLDGKLFIVISLFTNGKGYLVCKDYYTALDGIVYSINEKELTESGDTLFDLQKDCICVGDYNESEIYTSTSKQIDLFDLIKINGL